MKYTEIKTIRASIHSVTHAIVINSLILFDPLTRREHLGRCHQNQAMGLRHCRREAFQLRVHLREQQTKHGFRVHQTSVACFHLGRPFFTRHLLPLH